MEEDKYYLMYERFLNGEITREEWLKYTDKFLEELMENYKETLRSLGLK